MWHAHISWFLECGSSNGIPIKPWHKQDVLVARRWNSNENTTSQRYYRRIAKWNVTTAIGWMFNLNVAAISNPHVSAKNAIRSAVGNLAASKKPTHG